MEKLNREIKPYTEQLLNHPVYAAVKSMKDLRIFMEHHVYCVFDFMSLLKYLQAELAPSTYPWIPRGDPSLRRFINEMVLDEESDVSSPAVRICIHTCILYITMEKLNREIKPYTEQLLNHPVYAAVKSMKDLRIFMEHHVYCVFDFMSLLKCLQAELAPSTYPWIPRGDPSLRRFINEMVLDEESDVSSPGAETYISHFELYCDAMKEVGADCSHALEFLVNLKCNQLDFVKTLRQENRIPPAAQKFLNTTFGIVQEYRPYEVAAAFAYGRELIIPKMFEALLERMKIPREEAASFYYYLERHIEVDGDSHGPLAFKMVDALCEGIPERYEDASAVAKLAIKSRLQLWDGVKTEIEA